MPRPVVAIIGAGASHVSGRYEAGDRPPLTTQLFSRGQSRELLKRYRLARAAGSVIDRDMKADSAVAFEEALLRLQNDGHDHHKQMALAVPPFLQALLLEYSETLQSESSRYGVLVDELLKLGTNVHFVSLNYDTLLDNELGAFSPLRVLDDYINTPLHWTLIKPHGSVNWYVDQGSRFDPTAPSGDLSIRDEPIECVPASTFDLGAIRGVVSPDPHGSSTRYPAIALPDGPKDKLMLPAPHERHLRNMLASSNEIDVLVLGYSALDTEILELIKLGAPNVRRMTVVNAGPADALEVFDRIHDFGIEPIWADTFDGSYEQWIDDGGLRAWVNEYDKRFTSVTKPDELRRRIAARAAEREANRRRAERENIMTRQM